jgi:hypothetical protein
VAIVSADTKKVVKWGVIIFVGLMLWSWFGGAITGKVAAQGA